MNELYFTVFSIAIDHFYKIAVYFLCISLIIYPVFVIILSFLILFSFYKLTLKTCFKIVFFAFRLELCYDMAYIHIYRKQCGT